MKLWMDSKDFLCDDLFIYWRTRPTKELDVFWEQFILENKHLDSQFRQAVTAFDAIRDKQNYVDFNENLMHQKLIERIEMQKKRKIRKLSFLSTVAAVVVMALVSTFIILNRNTKSFHQEITSIGKTMSEKNVQLITGNDVLEIESNSTLTLAEKKNSAYIRDSVSQKEIDLKNSQTNKLIVPFGKRSSVVLADGSTVQINSGTEIEFPTAFIGNTREIGVKGEIFIDVAKQNNKPFIIRTPNSQITVYGTSFNVSSYPDEKNESIVLVNGSVEIKSEDNSIMLKPSEMAEIENGIIQRKKVNVSEYISWKSGYMELNKTPLNDVLKKIGRYYNVEFQYENELNLTNQTCSGKLFLSENFDNVLNAFSKMTFLTYDKNNNNTINIKKPN